MKIEKIWLTEMAICIRTDDGREAQELFSDYPRLRYATRLLATPLFLLSGVLLALLSWPQWQVTAAAITLWFLLAIARQLSFHITTKALGLPSYIFTLHILRHRIPRWDFASWLRWRTADKRTFRRKFV